MYSQNQKQDIKQLDDLRTGGAKFTKESYEAYRQCMSEAKFSAGMPLGIMTMGSLYFGLPKMNNRNMVILVGGLVMYIIGKTSQVHKCYMKSLAHITNNSAHPMKRRQQSLYTGDSDNNSDQQKEEDKHFFSFNNVTEDDSTWEYRGTEFESYSNEFNDTSDIIEEKVTNMQKSKTRVTYDDLWKQHRIEETRNIMSNTN